jgi:hypothetical protein
MKARLCPGKPLAFPVKTAPLKFKFEPQKLKKSDGLLIIRRRQATS